MPTHYFGDPFWLFFFTLIFICCLISCWNIFSLSTFWFRHCYIRLQIHRARQFYENLVPSYTIYDIECSDHSFRKFTSDGNYLICFSRSYRELIVYRHRWLSYCYKGEDCECNDLPQKAKNFESYFSHLYSIPLTSSNEFTYKEFFLYMENHQFGIVATSTAPD